MIHSTRYTVLPRRFMGGALRHLEPSDLPTFQAYRSIPELGRYQGWSAMSDEKALEFLTEMNSARLFCPGKWIQIGIADLMSDHLIGDIGIFLTKDESSAEIGFTLEPSAQGRGIGTAAVREAIHLVFLGTRVGQVVGITDSRNAPSARLLRRVGFHLQESRYGVFRAEPCVEDVYVLGRNNG